MSDQDFLARIRETEERSEAMIAQAQADARKRVEDARAAAERRLAEARAKADRLYRLTLEEAGNRADGKDRDETAAAAGQAGLLRVSAAPAVDHAVRIVAERIVK